MDTEIWVDADQVGIEGGVVNFREGQSIRHDRLAQLLVGIRYDVGGIEEPRFREPTDRTAAPVGGQHGISERCLVQTLLYLAEGIATFRSGWDRGLSRSPEDRPESELN